MIYHPAEHAFFESVRNLPPSVLVCRGLQLTGSYLRGSALFWTLTLAFLLQKIADIGRILQLDYIYALCPERNRRRRRLAPLHSPALRTGLPRILPLSPPSTA